MIDIFMNTAFKFLIKEMSEVEEVWEKQSGKWDIKHLMYKKQEVAPSHNWYKHSKVVPETAEGLFRLIEYSGLILSDSYVKTKAALLYVYFSAIRIRIRFNA